MKKIDSILVATDFSSDAGYALDRTVRLSAMMQASATALHVIETSWIDAIRKKLNFSAPIEESLINDALSELRQSLSSYNELYKNNILPEVLTGNVHDVISLQAINYDLLVLGARGNHPLRDFTLGTTSEKLLRRTIHPLLVVKKKPKDDYRRVMVAIDFSTHSLNALKYCFLIAPTADVHLVHIYNEPGESKMRLSGVLDEIVKEYRMLAFREAEEEMKKFINYTGAYLRKVNSCIEHSHHAPTCLKEKAKNLDADLIVVGRHGKSLTEQLLLGSVTLHMLNECHTDILVTQ